MHKLTFFPLGNADCCRIDYGTIVGWYNTQHGFIFHNNAWATLDYPNARSLRKCPRSTIPTKLKR